MQIQKIWWSTYRLPLANGFTTAHTPMQQTRTGAIVEIEIANKIIGIGEIAPLPEFGGSTLHECITALTEFYPTLINQELASALSHVYTALHYGRIPAATACGLEIALLDALGQARQYSVSALLCDASTPPCTTIPVNAVIGAATTEQAIKQAQQAVEAGFQCIKLKVGHDAQQDVERVTVVRASVGPTVQLRLDANEGWTLEQAMWVLRACESLDIQYVEQPLAAGDLTGMRELRRRVSVPLAVDEALRDLTSAQLALEAEAADVFVIKPQLAGGLRAGREMITLAQRSRVQCVITGAMEAGIGLAGVAHLAAASPEITTACGLATAGLFVDDLILDGLPIQHGIMSIPTGPGLGVQLDRAALTRYSSQLGRRRDCERS
jgi:o-succinylbenzoate synthase